MNNKLFINKVYYRCGINRDLYLRIPMFITRKYKLTRYTLIYILTKKQNFEIKIYEPVFKENYKVIKLYPHNGGLTINVSKIFKSNIYNGICNNITKYDSFKITEYKNYINFKKMEV
jgi:hypothetical protein